MTREKPVVIVGRPGRHSTSRRHASNRLLKAALWLVWLPITAVVWVMLLDTSYDWISSPSDTKVMSGLMILILMATVVIAVVVKGARKWWTR
jgi:polyferredoxin